MVDLIVQRHGGDSPGDDIVDPLISTDAVALARGRNELDARAGNKQDVTYNMIPVAGVLPGTFVEVFEVSTGQSFRAKVKSVSKSKALGESRMTLKLERVGVF